MFTVRYGFSCAGLGAENQFSTCCGMDDYTMCSRQLLMKALHMDSFKFPQQLSLSVQRIIRLTCAASVQTFANPYVTGSFAAAIQNSSHMARSRTSEHVSVAH